MPRPSQPTPVSARPFVLARMGLALGLGMAVWWLWPEGDALWRRGIAVVLGIALAHQLVAAVLALPRGRVVALQAWLECLAFPLVMGAVHFLPGWFGWLLLLIGWAWRLLVQNLWSR